MAGEVPPIHKTRAVCKTGVRQNHPRTNLLHQETTVFLGCTIGATVKKIHYLAAMGFTHLSLLRVAACKTIELSAFDTHLGVVRNQHQENSLTEKAVHAQLDSFRHSPGFPAITPMVLCVRPQEFW